MAIKDQDIEVDYTINQTGSLNDDYRVKGESNSSTGRVPFRFFATGPFNLRGQTSTSYYKTFLGKQKS
jgi:hypothetical protein